MPAQRKYPEELRERAVKMVLEIRAREGKGRGELARVGRQLGVHPEVNRPGFRAYFRSWEGCHVHAG